jgi:hypothetical protein
MMGMGLLDRKSSEPAAPAEPWTGPTYEYRAIGALGKGVMGKLDELGAQGFRVVAGDNTRIILMRERQP